LQLFHRQKSRRNDHACQALLLCQAAKIKASVVPVSNIQRRVFFAA